MSKLRSWLLALAQELLEREGFVGASHDYDHIVRVMALAETIQEQEGGDLPTIWAAVTFHDVGQERERRNGGDHAIIGAAMASSLLTGNRPFIPALKKDGDEWAFLQRLQQEVEGKLQALGKRSIARTR